MALDETTGIPSGSTATKKKRPAGANPSDFSAVAVLTSGREPAATDQGKPPSPPHPTLAKYGFEGSVDSFNQRLRAVTDAYEKRYGYKPSPGLAFDVARNPKAVPLEQIPNLFLPTKSKVTAPALFLAGVQAPRKPVLTDKALYRGALDALAHGDYQDWIETHGEPFEDLLRRRPDVAVDWVRASSAVRAAQGRSTGGSALSSHLPKDFGATPNIGLTDQDVATLGLASTKFIGTPAHVAAQFAGSIAVGIPVLAIAEFQGARQSIEQRSARPFARTQVQLAKGTLEGVKRDVTDPTHNLGYLAADAFAAITAGAGLASRASAVARAEGVAAKAKAAVKRPLPGVIEVRKGDLVEHEIAFQNPALRAVQRVINDARNRNLDARFSGAPAGLNLLNPKTLFDRAVDLLPSEAKLARLGAARSRVEQALQDVPAVELQHAAKASETRMKLNQRLPAKLRRGLSTGEEKAIQVLATDDPNPWQTWRQFHESRIETATDPKVKEAHRGQLAALDLAKRALDNPRPQFLEALHLTAEVMARQQAIKIAELGLAPTTAESRVARLGAVLRGEPVTEPAHLTDPKLAAKLDDLREQLTTNLVEQARYKTNARSFERAAGGPAEGEARDATFAKLRSEESALRTQIDELEQKERLTKLERVNPDSFYLPFPKERLSKKEQARYIRALAAGDFGIPLPRKDPSLTHVFTGRSIQAGDFRIDVTNVAAETYARTARLASRFALHRDHVAAGTPIPRSPDDIAVRTVDKIPNELRALHDKLDQGEALTPDEAAALTEEQIASLDRLLYPPELRADAFEEPIEGVVWINPKQILGGRSRAPFTASAAGGKFVKTAEVFNEFFRTPMLFVRPAYAINALSNAGFLFLEDFPRAIPSMAKSLYAKKLYGKRIMNELDALAGEGRNLSYVDPRLEDRALASGRTLARFWNQLVDRWMRRAAIISELDRRGIRSGEQIRAWLDDAEKGPERVEVSRRGQKAMVEFGNLLPFEQDVLRHILFVYPWVSRATVWSIRTLAEHPLKSDVLAQLGREQEDELDDQLGNVVAWFKRAGYVPLGWDADGNPKVIGSSQLSAFSTLRDMVNLGEAVFADSVPYTEVSDNLGPAASFFVHFVTGRDSYGNKYDSSALRGAIVEALSGLPQVRAAQRGNRKSGELPAVDVADRRTLIKRERAALKTIALSPGWLDGWGTLIASGLVERKANKLALVARYWRDAPIEERYQHELDLINRVLTMQASLLERPLPDGVRRAIDINNSVSLSEIKQARDLGHSLTPLEKDLNVIDVLEQRERIDAEKAQELRDDAHGLQTETEHGRFRGRVLARYGNGADLAAWQTDVSAFAAFHNRDAFQHQVDVLAGRGLLKPQKLDSVAQKTLDEYGRRFVAYTEQVDALKAKNATPAELRAFADENDHSVLGLPSPVRMAWAAQTNEQQAAHMRSILSANWDTLSALDKELLGRDVAPGVEEAWAAFDHVTSPQELAKQLPPGERELDKGQRLAIVKQLDAHYGLNGAFVDDYRFSQRPLFQRLAQLDVIKRSPNRADWQQIFQQAQALQSAIDSKTTSADAAHDAWRDYATQLPAFIEQSRPQFWRELKPLLEANPDFLTSLLN